jgi:hypothetical protein
MKNPLRTTGAAVKRGAKRTASFFKQGTKNSVYAARLTKSIAWMRFRKHAPHKWVMNSHLERKQTGVYARCKRCGATR